jgi:predicted alpha/beta-fold hydrolase
VRFQPPFWCRNPHVQTLWGPLLRRRRVALRRERFETHDGDFVDLDWLDGPPSAPLLLVLHGLEGTARSHYVAGLVTRAAREGWRAAVLYFRSCSGETNRLPRFYHAGETGDLDEVVRALVAREANRVIGAVGVSIGGNVLLKWLGEQGKDVPPEVVAGVGISVPFAIAPCTRVLDQGLERLLYTSSFMRTFKAKVREKARAFPGFVDVRAALRARTFAEYDRVVTAPLNGFSDAMDYWTRASSIAWLPRVRRPALLLSALDDPLVPAEALPDPATLPPWIVAEFTPHGGHVGFVHGRWPWATESWAERRAIEFVAERFARQRGTVRRRSAGNGSMAARESAMAAGEAGSVDAAGARRQHVS